VAFESEMYPRAEEKRVLENILIPDTPSIEKIWVFEKEVGM
jgi:hypothetical protein